MKSIALLLAPVLLVSGAAAYAQADRQAATQHERSGTHQPAAGEKQCCCAEMMRKMMMEMMQQHQMRAAKPGQQFAPGEAEKPHQEHKQ